ncbi:MAG: hypothetical protein DMF56_19315 [Acidobacteria bacterium]|nr:MAG: hypothetical protein DMF56_19315 [Acidobacteriota bacterium]
MSETDSHLEIARENLALYRSEVRELRRQFCLGLLSAIAGLIGAVAALLALLIAIRPLARAAEHVEDTSRNVKSIETAILSNRLTILSLSNGDEVSRNETVSGLTPFTHRRHYLVVAPVNIGDSYVQDAMTPRPDGTWTGTAKFGSGDTGRGERFSVRCLATEGELRTGSLASQSLPSDAVFSAPVIVVRTQ